MACNAAGDGYKPVKMQSTKKLLKREIKTMTTNNRESIINAIIEYFKSNENVFNDCMEELDGWNGYLGDDRYYEMYDLDEFYSDCKPSELLMRVFYGYDEDTSSENNHTEFNPNREYFRYNGYGNLVSADYKDYSDHLDHWAIESLSENRNHIDAIDDDSELSELFDSLEEVETEEE